MLRRIRHHLRSGPLCLLSSALIAPACTDPDGAARAVSDTHGATTSPPHGEVTHGDTDATGRLNVTATVDLAERHQTIAGFGATLIPFELPMIYFNHDATQPKATTASLEQRQALSRLLFEELGMTRVRTSYRDLEPVNDNADPNTFNWSAFLFSGSLVGAQGALSARLEPAIDFIKLSQPFGLVTHFPMTSLEWDADWLHTPGARQIAPGMEPEVAEMLAAVAKRYADEGLPLPYLSVANEPDWGSGLERVLTTAQMVQIVKLAGARMRSLGLDTKLVISESYTLDMALAYAQAVLADPDARPYLGAIAYHGYGVYGSAKAILETSGIGAPLDAEIAMRRQIRDLAASYGLPIWETETSASIDDLGAFRAGLARVNHLHDELTLADVSAFDQMNLFFIDRPNLEGNLVNVTFGGDGALASFEAAPVGILMSHWARYARPGAVRVGATTTDPMVRASAFEAPGNQLVVVLINNRADEVALQVDVADATLGAAGQQIQTTDTTDRDPRALTPANASGFVATLPGESVTTFVLPIAR